MLKKEISETLKQAGFFIATALIVPGILLLIMNLTYLEIFFPCFQFGLFFWALLMGNFIFSLDRGQRGIEYLLSLPYSRIQIIGIKFLPRMFALTILYLLYLVIHYNGGSNAAAIAHPGFTGLYFSLFLIAFSFSASSENFVISSLVSVFFLFVYIHLFYLELWIVSGFINMPFSWNINEIFVETSWEFFTWSWLPVSIILIIPFPIAFILAFRKFDIRPSLAYNKKYFKHLVLILIPALAFSFLVAFIGKREFSRSYYLTQNNKLIESNWIFDNMKIYDQEKVAKMDALFSAWNAVEIDQYVIGGSFEYRAQKRLYVLKKLDLRNYEIKSLYEIESKDYIGYQTFWKFNKEILLLQKGKNSAAFTLVIIDVLSGKVKRIETNLSLDDFSAPRIFGTDKLENRRFWLVSLRKKSIPTVWRLWEDGEIDNLGDSYKLRPFYLNRMLFMYNEEGIQAYTIDSAGKKFFRDISGCASFSLSYRNDMSNVSLTEIYGWLGQKIVRLDLKNFELSEIGDNEGYINYIFPHDFYYLDMPWDDRTLYKLYQLKDGSMKFIQEFHLSKVKKYKPSDGIYIFKNGIVLAKKRKVKVFTFPDMKVLKLKGL